MPERFLRNVRKGLEKHIPTTERSVVHLLAQIRKVLECTKTGSQYEWLRFYCDWALHSEMNRKLAKTILRDLDLGFDEMIRTGQLSAASKAKYGPITSMSRLADQLREFCQEFKIPVDTLVEPLAWSMFLVAYIRVVSNTRLKYVRHDGGVDHVFEVAVGVDAEPTGGCTKPSDENFAFRVKWSLIASDGRLVGTWNFDYYFAFDADVKQAIAPHIVRH
jgi:hypothetical protein